MLFVMDLSDPAYQTEEFNAVARDASMVLQIRRTMAGECGAAWWVWYVFALKFVEDLE